MKKLTFMLAAMLLCSVALQARNAEETALWEQANKSYMEGNWETALQEYAAISDKGAESADLYYNIGNCYYKLGNLGKSILYYNKALKLAPSDQDIRHNLEVANARTTNKINAVPQFFLNRWAAAFRGAVSSNGWAQISLAAFALTLALTLIFLLSRTATVRKVTFSGGIVFLLLFVISTVNAASQKRQQTRSGDAIVMQNAVPVKSSPDREGKDLFVLNEGAKVTVTDKLGGWSQVEIASGNKGWIENRNIESVD